MSAIAQPVTDRVADHEIARLKTDFEYGRYEEVLSRATERINRGNLTEEELIEAHKYAGLSAFYLKKKPEAQRHLVALLQLDPDYSLDPFVVPPAAVAFLENLRKERAGELEMIRAERRLRAERLRRAEEERERARREAEEQRRRLQESADRPILRSVETTSYVVNFVPFGAGQFQQGRTKMGVLFAVSEGLLAVTSVIAFLAYNGMITERSTVSDIRLTADGRPYTFVERGIPFERRKEATVWRNVKYVSGGGFWLVYGVGVWDALRHHNEPPPLPTTGAVEQPPPGWGASLSLSF